MDNNTLFYIKPIFYRIQQAKNKNLQIWYKSKARLPANLIRIVCIFEYQKSYNHWFERFLNLLNLYHNPKKSHHNQHFFPLCAEPIINIKNLIWYKESLNAYKVSVPGECL